MNKKGIDRQNINENISPREDFYGYACGGWIKNNPMPAEFSCFGTFDKLREDARLQLKDLILNLSESKETKETGTISQKIWDIFSMGMDEERLNREKAEPLMPVIEKIEEFKSENLTDYLVWLHSGLDSTFFSTGVGPDPKDSDRNILHIGETGLGLGDRDYYLEETEENIKIMVEYEKFIKKIVKLINKNEEEQKRIWNNFIKIEKDIALNKMTREQRRDPMLRFNMYSREELKNKFNNIEWDGYFQGLEINPDEANVSSVGFLTFMNDYLPQLSEREIKDYLIVSLICNSTGLLSDDFTTASFEFFGKVMSGQKEQKPRWKRAMALPNSMFGEAVGQLYVRKYFPRENKEYMVKLVENLRKALKKHISELDWMTEETKEKALDKLQSMTVKIGYPDKWKDYSELVVDPKESYLVNVQRASQWFTKDNYSKLGKPVDKEEWHMTPQTVNAYYSPVTNEICFPAAILQPPFFDFNADDALNYGAIGVVIGHEMTHGFDDQGRRFDKNGNLNNWWTKEDEEKFESKTSLLEDQFNRVEILPGLMANGKYTLGENIADQGGLRISLTAYNDSDSPKEIIDDLTPLQRFYLSYAGVWASNITDEEIRLRTKSDPHSLGRNRVNETLKNIKPFFDAFNIKDGDKMFRSEKDQVVIW